MPAYLPVFGDEHHGFSTESGIEKPLTAHEDMVYQTPLAEAA
jgi:hypothetical protein